jgi:pyruvate kinase
MEKIIVTVGPSSLKEDTIKKMDNAGVDVFRINMSHSSIDDFCHFVENMQKWTNKPLCPDTEGAQLRTGRLLGDGTLVLKPYEYVEFIPYDQTPEGLQIPLNTPPSEILRQGDLLKIDFNAVIIQVTEIEKSMVRGRVLEGGVIGTNKGIGVDREITMPAFSQKDLEVFKTANRLGLKMIALSFASSGEDVKKLRSFYDYDVEVISKVESKTALKNLDSICKESNAVLIDRGDLSRDVPLEKIIFAQRYIIEQAKALNTPVYVATNLMENMIKNSKPTRAEVHDIISTLNNDIDGLVLAAETAVGKYPLECVRIMSRIIKETKEDASYYNNIEYLTTTPSDRIIEPHGGELIQQFYKESDKSSLSGLPSLSVDERVLSDILQICEGVYSPVDAFMNKDELESVLDHYQVPSGVCWSLPILLQVKADEIQQIPETGDVAIKFKGSYECYAILKVKKIEKINDMESIAKRWFGTADSNHPGVQKFLNAGDFIISGTPFLIQPPFFTEAASAELTPKQTRAIINDAGWHNVVGFHTRNVPHLGHEFIQKEALEKTNADALFISPVVGRKKPGDFKGKAIIKCYEKMIMNGYYNPYGIILSAFNTYSRYSGPREAVFTALCRKNFGCNHFVIGRDHTGVGEYYSPDASIKIFSEVDAGMNIVDCKVASFCIECGEVTTSCQHSEGDKKAISGSRIRDSLVNESDIPWYMMRKDISLYLQQLYREDQVSIIE